MQKEVIFVSNFLGNGGAGRVMGIIADYFVKNGIKTTIVIYNDIGKSYETDSSIHLCKINKTYPSFLGKVQRILKLRNYLKTRPNTTVIAFEYFVNMETILATRALSNKVIVSERVSPDSIDNRKVTKMLRDILYKYTDLLICQTNEAKLYFPEAVQRKTIVIANPIKDDLPIGANKKKNELVTFCRITEQKNLKMMIDSFAILLQDYPEYTLSIYGDGEIKDTLITYCKTIGINSSVNFYSFVQDVHEKIAESTLFLSTSDFEGLSNSMLEAMAMGIPVVCTDCDGGGAKMIIENKKNGMLVPKGDMNAFYEAMKYLLDNKDEREKIRKNALKIREELSIEKICGIWMDLVHSNKID